MRKVLIDADGCPVVDHAVRVAAIFQWKCIILCDTSHYFLKDGAETITVPKGADSVDFALVNMLEPGDVVITQDYGLAAMCLARQAVPVNQDGMIYDHSNIDGLLMARHTARKVRNAGGRLRGSKRRPKEKNEEFEKKFRSLLEQLSNK